jgi:hypothetical protein
MGLFKSNEQTYGDKLLEAFYSLASEALFEYSKFSAESIDHDENNKIEEVLYWFYKCQEFLDKDNNLMEITIALSQPGKKRLSTRESELRKSRYKFVCSELNEGHRSLINTKITILAKRADEENWTNLELEFKVLNILINERLIWKFGRGPFPMFVESFDNEDWMYLDKLLSEKNLSKEAYREFRSKKKEYVNTKNKERLDKGEKPIYHYLYED